MASNKDLSKSVRLLFNKAVKALDNSAYDKAGDTIQLKGQQLKLDEARARKRRKVAINAQQSFADIEVIKAAQEVARREEERAADYEKRFGTKKAIAEAKAVAYKSLEACLSEFVVDTTVK